MRRVVITGAGAVTALGNDWTTLRPRLLAHHSAVRAMPEWNCYPELKTRLGAPVDQFEMPAHFNKKKLRSSGRVARLALVATEAALADAGLADAELLGNGAMGVAYGSANGDSSAALEFFELLDRQRMQRVNGTTYLRYMSHTAAVNIAVAFGISGQMHTTSSACTSGSQAIGAAFEAIRHGRQVAMVAGGADALCPTQAAVFDVTGAASTRHSLPVTSPRPFDAARDGLVLGEGACSLVLEELTHAQARGAAILGEVVGYATNCDGGHIVRPSEAQQATVMRAALADAGLPPEAIGYISAHATGTRYGDVAEANATRAVYGSSAPLSSLKGHFGHSLGACGALEAWIGLCHLRENWLPPTLNLERVADDCADLDHVMGQVRHCDTEFFASHNFAFGGINTALIFRRW